MKVRPLGDKVIVKRDEAQSKTDSGIFIPEAAKDKPKQGKIVALGSGILNKDTGKYMPFTVKKGDTVLFTTYSGTEIKIDGETFIIMTEEDILGIIDWSRFPSISFHLIHSHSSTYGVTNDSKTN